MEKAVTPLSSQRQLYDRESSSGRTGRCEDEVCWSNVLPADTWCSHAITCQEQLSFQPKVTHTQTERGREVRRKKRVNKDTRGKKKARQRATQRCRERKESENEMRREKIIGRLVSFI